MNSLYHFEKHDQELTVCLDIENLDGGVCTRLLEDLSALMPSDKQVVLDTGRVQFADSSGLGLIRSLERILPNKKLVLRNVGSRLLRCLQRLPEDKIPVIEFQGIQNAGSGETESISKDHSPDTIPEDTAIKQKTGNSEEHPQKET